MLSLVYAKLHFIDATFRPCGAKNPFLDHLVSEILAF